jgi:hypothetical protein
MRLVNVALVAVFVLSVALLAPAFSPWPAPPTPRVTVVAGECAQLSAVPGEPNTYVLQDRACQDAEAAPARTASESSLWGGNERPSGSRPSNRST